MQTCSLCKAAVPDRAKAANNVIKTDYELVDTFPHFPILKKSIAAGCGLCWIIRKALRHNWAARPMEEWGVGPLSERDPAFADLLDEPWDCRVRISSLKFVFDSFLGSQEAKRDTDVNNPSPQRGGMVTGMSLEFGPVTPSPTDDCAQLHDDISQVLRFKVFDSIGTFATMTCETDMAYADPASGRADLDSQETSRRGRLPSDESLSDDNINMIQGWASDCESYHLPCRVPASAAWRPTRLLHVGSNVGAGPEPRDPRLVETGALTDCTKALRYAALSHMWGDVQESAPPLQAMNYNYADLKDGISLGRLPRNFADAVETCRRLGIEYIWIDSLCIIQDSKEDWKREAATMHMVYKNAFITIAA